MLLNESAEVSKGFLKCIASKASTLKSSVRAMSGDKEAPYEVFVLDNGQGPHHPSSLRQAQDGVWQSLSTVTQKSQIWNSLVPSCSATSYLCMRPWAFSLIYQMELRITLIGLG